MARDLTNLAASVRARLLNRAKQDGQTFQSVLNRYAIERLLSRLAASPYAEQFVLKGAQLFRLWFATPHRTTKDLDLAGYGVGEGEMLAAMMQAICTAEVEPDGLIFDPATVRVEPIRVEQEYHGSRVHLRCRLEQARLDVQIDIGYGDAIAPAAAVLDFPTLLDFPAPRLRVYPMEATIAEKFHAMVMLGGRNSRTKDFFDVWTLATQCPFEGARLTQAIAATFGRRGDSIAVEPPLALTAAFADNQDQIVRWLAFTRRLDVPAPPAWAEVLAVIRDFLGAPCAALAAGEQFGRHWPPGGPWV